MHPVQQQHKRTHTSGIDDTKHRKIACTSSKSPTKTAHSMQIVNGESCDGDGVAVVFVATIMIIDGLVWLLCTNRAHSREFRRAFTAMMDSYVLDSHLCSAAP